MFLRATICTLGIALVSAVSLRADPGDTEFFEKKIRPLIEQRCIECHSTAKKVKGGLRLDSRDGWQTGGDTGPALVPGKPDDSLLITAVRYRDKDLQMPPKKKLSADEIATLEQWVKMGAPDPRSGAVAGVKKQKGMSIGEGKKFWSYVAPEKIAPPAVKDAIWPRGDIDRFILAKIEEKGLRPAADASPEVLIRRLYYTLTGLPPSPEQVDHFVADSKRDPRAAMEEAADELLASPHFGETWGRHWLDVARFAESSGGGRTLLFKDAWRYRDYVIDAFNRDEPFDRFIREQIAGDLLPAATSEDRRRQVTATAFLALGPTNYEEQNKQQLRFDVIDEQLDTLGKGILGQTIGCARCHDHKFDPIPQRDYYALAGILASTRTLFNYTDNVARWISEPLKLDGEEEQKVAAHEAKIASLKQEFDAVKKDLAKMKAASSKAGGQPGKSTAAADLPGIIVDDADAKPIGGWSNSKFTAGFIGEGYKTDDNEGKGKKTITFAPKLPKSGRYEVRFAYPPHTNRAKKVPVHVFHADGQETVFVDETQEPPIDGRFVSLGKFRFEQDGAGFVLVSNEGTKGYVVADAIQFLSEEDLAALDAAAKPTQGDDADKRSAADKRKKMDLRAKEMESEMKKLTSEGPHRPTAMAVHDDEETGDTQIRVRGIVGQRGAQVPRGFLQVLGNATPKLSQKESGRRELADWLASPANPLTARVFVNRAWDWSFGSGIVRTTENFGTTGEAPSHPELLDWLALRFIHEGWSVKKLVREIVLSHAWQTATGTTPGDPDNRLFAHANRRRLDAEEIRDTMLAVSGELDLRTMGPNIGNAGEINANDSSAQNIEYKYEFTDTRRSVYTPAFRNRRLELFEAFDFADINAPFGHRNASTVAPQALYLLNSPFVLAQAKAAAERALASSAGDEERLANAFRTTLCRLPTEKERAIFSRALAGAGGASGDKRIEAWSQIYQTLFCSLDFRFLE
ncbi:MAG: DUF1553 domain-containing protein [Chthoniobacteraceae bacterium]